LNNGTATVALDGGIGPFVFNWSHDANLNGPSASNLAPGDYQVEVTDMGIPCAQPFLLNYTITEFGPLPILFLSTDDTTPCIGDTIVVNGASNSTFAWTNPVPFQTSGNSAEFIVTPNFTGVQAIATNLCGPTTANLSISPVSSPDISILTNPVICQNSPFVLDASLTGNGLLTWTTPNGSVLNGTTANLGPAQLSQAGWYYATSTFSGCEPVLDSIEITVDELPIVNVASASICVGENVDITILPIENYTWPLLPGISQNNGGANATLSPTISTNYVVQNIHQCAVNINITVLPLPEPLISVSTLQGCSPLGVQFTDNTVEPLSFSWDFGDGQTSINESPFHVFAGTNSDTTYTVQLSITDNNGCVNQNNFFIQTMVPVDAQFTANPISQIYPDAVVDFTNVSTGSGTLSAVWLYENETSTNFNSASHTFSTWGNFTVSLIVENEWCNDTAVQEIVILPPAAIANFNFLDDGCPQSQFNFLSESIFAESVTWLFGDGNEGEGESTSHVYQSEGIYDVTLLAHGFDGITDTFTIANAVTIHPEPVAAFTIDEDYVFAEVDSAVFFNQSTGGTQYFWNFGNGNTSSAFEPTPYYALVGRYDISLTVSNNFGCQDQYIVPNGVTVVSDGFINFPSAFTPLSNGPTDGIYDRFAFDNNIFHPHSRSIKFYELEIFNKWGEMIFQTDDIKQGWDGYYQGQMVNEDIYVYKSKGQLFGGVPFEKSGTITLLLK
jgi:gliding motility-associated-like protein